MQGETEGAVQDGEIIGEVAPHEVEPSPAGHIDQYQDNFAHLPYRVRNDARAAVRIAEAQEELLRYSERVSAERLAQRWDVSRERASEVVRAALVTMAHRDTMPVAERRALVAERSEYLMRMALDKTRALVAGDEVVYAPDPDLSAANRALEFQAKLYGTEQEPGGRVLATVLEVAKECLDGTAYATLVHALARKSGDAVASARAELPSGSGIEDAEITSVPTKGRVGARTRR